MKRDRAISRAASSIVSSFAGQPIAPPASKHAHIGLLVCLCLALVDLTLLQHPFENRGTITDKGMVSIRGGCNRRKDAELGDAIKAWYEVSADNFIAKKTTLAKPSAKSSTVSYSQKRRKPSIRPVASPCLTGSFPYRRRTPAFLRRTKNTQPGNNRKLGERP